MKKKRIKGKINFQIPLELNFSPEICYVGIQRTAFSSDD